MRFETQSMHITPVGGNAFADLGFEAEEAAALKAESQCIISVKLAIKESLITELAGWIEAQQLEQAQVARILGVTRSRVSHVINKKHPEFTIDALVDMLSRTGKCVRLSVQ